ncbi:MAG: hypothetical protein HYV41_00050 [Candidatus Magasanikbacteria bacterium]|nr:hypothetical protein [Candidatus Magasanikbacteria bacterium]
MKDILFEQLTETQKNLLQQAKEAGSHYFNKKGTRRVGSALLCSDASVYQGTSIRRTNVSNSTCAERMALDKAIFEKKYSYETIVIVGFFDGEIEDELISPCGLCRQILSEAENYSGERRNIEVLMSNQNFSKIIQTTTQELFPIAYQAKSYESQNKLTT